MPQKQEQASDMSEKKRPPKKKSASGAAQDGLEEVSFESALAELESIVGELEAGRLGLSDSLASYEKGVKYLRHCYELLENTEKKIDVLSGHDAEGRPIVEPFEEDACDDLDVKAKTRSARRTAQPGPSAAMDGKNSVSNNSGNTGHDAQNHQPPDNVDLPKGLF